MLTELLWMLVVSAMSALGLLTAHVLFAGHMTGVAHWDLLVSALAVALLLAALVWRPGRWQVSGLAVTGALLIAAPSVLPLAQHKALVWTHEIFGASLLAVALSVLFQPGDDTGSDAGAGLDQ